MERAVKMTMHTLAATAVRNILKDNAEKLLFENNFPSKCSLSYCAATEPGRDGL